jgi:putative permease
MKTTREFSYKRVALYTVLVLTTLAVAFVTYRLAQVVLLFVLSIVLAAALRLPIIWLQRHRIPRGVAILLLYLLIFTVLGLGLYFFGPRLGAEIARAVERVPEVYSSINRSWETSDREWQQAIAERLPHASDVAAIIAQHGTAIAYQFVGLTYSAFGIIISIIAVLTLTFYWLLDEDRFLNLWLTLLPVHHRTIARDAWYDIDSRIGIFVRSETIQFIITFLLLWLGLSALGIQYSTTWALFGGIAQLIPWIGFPLIVLPALPMFFTAPVWLALTVIALIIAVGVFINQVIDPLIGVKEIAHPIVSVLALILLGEAAGILGMIVALPLAATLQSILSKVIEISTTPQLITQSSSSSSLLTIRMRLSEIRERLPAESEQGLQLDGIIQRISALLDKTEQMAEDRASSPQRPMIAPGEHKNSIPSVFARDQ